MILGVVNAICNDHIETTLSREAFIENFTQVTFPIKINYKLTNRL